MNKYERALNNIMMTAWAPSEDYNILTELVERATPKKVIKKWETNYCCPICNEMLIEYEAKVNYCEDCGQALDWSDNNE